ncbi:MAG: serine/threonine protein kinase [Acidobacteria bacterium]|jgi:hypothetical protein|nr:serine/threonine protein kinase [Acidobacteriota bacterium]
MAPSPDPARPTAGSRIGPYELQELCYRAATGGVYLAHRPGSDALLLVARPRAASGLPSEESEETGARTTRRVTAARAFAHPGAARLVEAGADGEGAFVAWERPAGTRLDAFTTRGLALPAGTVVDLGRRLAAVLAAAHQAGLVHGDLRPEHVVAGADGSVKLVGLGLAAEGAPASWREEESWAGPDYLAPEQVAGRAPDARSDLFSLAALLYTLACGRTPFAGASSSSVLYRIVNDPPPPLRDRAPEVPPAFDEFFARALAKDPVARFPDAEAFGRALAELASLPLPRGPIGAPPGETRRAAAEPAGFDGSIGTLPSGASSGDASRRGRRGGAIAGGLAAALAVAALLWVVPYRLGADPFAARRRGVEDQLERALGPLGRALRTTEPERRVTVETEPAGLEWSVVGPARREAESRVAFLPGTVETITLQIVDPCRDGSARFSPAAVPERLVIPTAPRRAELEVASEPAGAEVLLDGTAQPQPTPTRVVLERCREHAIELRAAGHGARTVVLGAGQDESAWRSALAAVALAPLPSSWIVVPAAPRGLAVDVLARRDGALTRLGRAGEAIELEPGRHLLVLRDAAALYEQQVEIELAEGAREALAVRYPSIGWLAVRAAPPGGPVWLRRGGGPEVSLGEAAIARRPLVAGRYTVILAHPGTGARTTRDVEVRAGETAEVRVGSNEW